MASKSIEEKRFSALKKHDAKSLDLGSEQDKYIRLVQWARECLEKSLTDGIGYKKDGISKDNVMALTNIGIALERAVSAKIKYEKHQKAFAEQMSQEEEESAIEEHILGMDTGHRTEFLRKIVTRHNQLVTGFHRITGEDDGRKRSKRIGDGIQNPPSKEGGHSSDSGQLDEELEGTQGSGSDSE